MKVNVIGAGYVGLVSGVCLAAKGHDVTCLDTREAVVSTLNDGVPHIHEAGLPELLRGAIKARRFRAALMAEDRLGGSEITLVAVGTPTSDGRIDLTQIGEAAHLIGRLRQTADDFVSVVIKSTVVPGTTDTFVREIIERQSGKRLGKGFGLGMNPEFLREGNAVEDFMSPDRIVLGHDDPRTLERLHELYSPWECDKLAVNSRTAEMIKYANNCLLATQISAVNELANIAAAVGDIDIMDVMRGVRLDKRWSPLDSRGRRILPGILAYLVPGCGFGGSCFPKDVQAMRRTAEDVGLTPHILQAILEVNRAQPLQVVRLLEQALVTVKDKRILLLGLAFKPETDDVRESVSLRIIEEMSLRGAHLMLHDPIASANCRALFPETPERRYTSDWRASLDVADAVVLATRWDEYQLLAGDASLTRKLDGKTIVDARRMFSASEFPRAAYFAIGKSNAKERTS